MYNKPCSQQYPKYSSVHRQASDIVPEFRQNSLHDSDDESLAEPEHGQVLVRVRTPPPHDREHDPHPPHTFQPQEHVNPSHVPAMHNANNTTCTNNILIKFLFGK